MVTAKMETVMGWCVKSEVNQEESEQDEVDATKKGTDNTDVRDNHEMWQIFLFV